MIVEKDVVIVNAMTEDRSFMFNALFTNLASGLATILCAMLYENKIAIPCSVVPSREYDIL